MTIEFSNAKPAKNQSTLSIVLLVVSCLFFFIPASLVVLGYYSSLPTGTLISPIPQGILSNDAPPQIATDLPIVASPDIVDASLSATVDSNSQQNTITLPANQKEVVVNNVNISENSQIYIINRETDKSLYSVASKTAGQFTLSSNEISVDNRDVDYQIVNP